MLLEAFNRIQRKTQMVMGDESVPKSPDTFEHRPNVGCIVLMYRYIQGKISTAIKKFIYQLSPLTGLRDFFSVPTHLSWS